MTTVNKSALVPYSAENMFKLVDDILAYPEFLPWCDRATEISRDDNVVEASLHIAHTGLNKAFATRNTNTPYEKIEMQLLDGPFKYLHGTWLFAALNESACKISLELDFEFSSKLVGLTFGPVFSKMANSLVDAFIKRAEAIYG